MTGYKFGGTHGTLPPIREVAEELRDGADYDQLCAHSDRFAELVAEELGS